MSESSKVIDVERLVRLDDQVALVTGGSSGLGERFARVLHAAGAHVIVSARRVDRLDGLASELGERIVAIPCDVTDQEQCSALVANVMGRFGRIDVLVNNAGVSGAIAAEDESLDHFRDVVEVNLFALFQLSQLVGRLMLDRGQGSIINIGSILGLVASSPINQASYCASKGAVVNLTRELAAQWSGRGVRVNAIAPGWFASEATAELWGDARSKRHLERGAPMGRVGAEDELDGVLLLLAGPGSSFMTGQTLTVDGGWTTR